MNKYIKNYPLSWIIAIIILFLSFCSIPESPMESIPLIDKWVHTCMYGCLSGMIWIEYLRSHKELKIKIIPIIIGAMLLPFLMSGLIELGQAYCTGGRRNGDWLDLAANSIGIIIASIIGYVFLIHFSKTK